MNDLFLDVKKCGKLDLLPDCSMFVVYSQKGPGNTVNQIKMAVSTGLIPKQEACVQDQIWKTDYVIYSAIIAQGTQTGKSNNFLPLKT